MNEGGSDAPVGEGRKGLPLPPIFPDRMTGKPRRPVFVTVSLWVFFALVAFIALIWITESRSLALGTHTLRLTVTVGTPERDYAGSSVWRIIRMCPTGFKIVLVEFPGVSGGGGTVEGDAVFVDLPGGGNLIALMAGGPNGQFVDLPRYLAAGSFQHAGVEVTPKRGTFGSGCNMHDAVGTVPVAPNVMPTLITFRDLADPASAEVIRPDELHRIVAGGRLKSVTVEMLPSGVWPLNLLPLDGPPDLFGTPVTRGIEKRLPKWKVKSYDDVRNADGSKLSQEQRQQLINIYRGITAR